MGKICPICNKDYSGAPALSRVDNETLICPDCGTLEALDEARFLLGKGMDDEQWRDYKASIVEEIREGKNHGNG